MRINQFTLIAIAAMIGGCTLGTNTRVIENPAI